MPLVQDAKQTLTKKVHGFSWADHEWIGFNFWNQDWTPTENFYNPLISRSQL